MQCLECGHGFRFGTMTFTAGEPSAEELAEAEELRRASHRQMLDAAVRATFRGHALDGRWTGLRWLGGGPSSPEIVTGFALAHGSAPWDPESPQIRVQTRIPDPPHTLDSLWCQIAVEYVREFWSETGKLPEPVRRAAFPQEPTAADPTDPWQEVKVPIDGVPVPFRVLGDDTFWVGQARHGEVVVGITATHWPIDRTGIVTVGEYGEYFAGLGKVQDRWPAAGADPDDVH